MEAEQFRGNPLHRVHPANSIILKILLQTMIAKQSPNPAFSDPVI
jgi:hypothetical protein